MPTVGNPTHTVTFVTAFIDIYPETYRDRDYNWRIDKFRKIANTGIPICLYTCAKTRDSVCAEFSAYENVRLMDYSMETDAAMYNTALKYAHCIVRSDNPEKDTAKFMALMHAKIDFVWDAMRQNPFQTDVFAWMDFNLAHVFREREPQALSWMRHFSRFQYRRPDLTPDGRFATEDSGFVCMPGCWHIYRDCDIHSNLLRTIHWRFCGGFFLGDRAGLGEFYRFYCEQFSVFMETYQTLVWEVNFWSWLEAHSPTGWRPIWYEADHTDSIVNLVSDVFSPILSTMPRTQRRIYPYPCIPNYLATSASFLELPSGEHVLNTRFVNYSVLANGQYHFLDGDTGLPQGIIRNINVVSFMVKDIETGLWSPLTYSVLNADMENLERRQGAFSEGLEDVRLFVSADSSTNAGGVRFLASTIDRAKTRAIEIVTGEYNSWSATVANCRVIESPTCANMEKNWIPVSSNRIVYRWAPLEVYRVEPDGTSLVQKTHHTNALFERMRGSSAFVPFVRQDLASHRNLKIGVVHYSEERWPRHYYHMLVVLDETEHAIMPVKYSAPFVFNRHSIEFCIGFTMDAENYHFWISNYDRDAEYMCVPVSSIDLAFDFVA